MFAIPQLSPNWLLQRLKMFSDSIKYGELGLYSMVVYLGKGKNDCYMPLNLIYFIILKMIKIFLKYLIYS